MSTEELRETVRRLYGAVDAGDVDSLGALFAEGDGTLLIGTDPAEWTKGSDAVRASLGGKPPAMRAAGVRLAPGEIDAHLAGDVGWFADRATLALPDSSTPVRLTGVLRRIDGRWKFAQLHLSIGAPNEDAIGVTLPA